LEFGGGSGRGIWFGSGQARIDGLQGKDRESRLRVGPFCGGDAAATIVVTAIGVTDYKRFGFWSQRILAVMNSLAEAACTRRRRRRERQWDKISHEREEQQPSGGQAMHGLAMLESLPTCRGRKQERGCGGSLLNNSAAVRNPQALPWIFAHHQRAPTSRKRQSWKNSGDLPSKAWPMNWRIHPRTKSANA